MTIDLAALLTEKNIAMAVGIMAVMYVFYDWYTGGKGLTKRR